MDVPILEPGDKVFLEFVSATKVVPGLGLQIDEAANWKTYEALSKEFAAHGVTCVGFISNQKIEMTRVVAVFRDHGPVMPGASKEA